ncbi:MAG: hypothetical protein EBQ97_01890, partial [Bacteroidetes bacterium]|nr:hypothetical protein [Bacteroidota bacterium]
GVQRWLYFAKYLSDFGVIPTIVTVDEKYASATKNPTTFIVSKVAMMVQFFFNRLSMIFYLANLMP